jgi:hypothetical protein
MTGLTNIAWAANYLWWGMNSPRTKTPRKAFLAGRSVLAMRHYGDTVFLTAGTAEFDGVTEDD